MKTYSISELAREFGVTPRALRFYEGRGMLHPRRSGQSRIYSSEDRARLKLILEGKRIGFSLSDIQEILDLYKLEGHHAQLRLAVRKFHEQIINLERQRTDIENALVELRGKVDWAEHKIAEIEEHGGDAEARASALAFEKVARVRMAAANLDG